jgi:sulfite exporter TauE/SafE
METLVITGLIIGLTSNFHCIGMCGPIAMAIPVNRKNSFTILGGLLQYNHGRVITYALLGAIVGSFGFTAGTFGVLQWLSIIAGIVLIIYAWRKYIGNFLGGHLPMFGMNTVVTKGMGVALQSQSPFKMVFLGAVNGLLPCGMVYVALMNALLAGNSLDSALAMAGFGIGTLPGMIAVGFAAGKMSMNLRSKFSKAVPLMLTVVGILVILRGLNLDIPYISPKVTSTETVQKETPKVEMSCCHSKAKCESDKK